MKRYHKYKFANKIKKWKQEMPEASWPRILWSKLEYKLNFIEWLGRFHFKMICKKAAIETQRFEINSKARAEIHTVLRHDDIYMYLLMIKSFLRFYNNVRVVVHDDGSLKHKDIKILTDHVAGIRIIDRNCSDKIVKEVLKDKRKCIEARESKATCFQAFDYFILSKTDKIISMDSDILFLEKPKEIIEWIESSKQYILWLYEAGSSCHFGYSRKNGNTVTRFVDFSSLPFKLLKNFNSGFFCVYSEIFNLDLSEKYLKYVSELDNKPDILFAQNVIGAFIADSRIPNQPLPLDKYKTLWAHLKSIGDFSKRCTFKHYDVACIRYRKIWNYDYDIKMVAKELKNKGAL